MRSDLRLALYLALGLFGAGMVLGAIGLAPTPVAEAWRFLSYPSLPLSVGPFAALLATVFFCAIDDRRGATTVVLAGLTGAAVHLALYGVPALEGPEGMERIYCGLTVALWLGVAVRRERVRVGAGNRVGRDRRHAALQRVALPVVLPPRPDALAGR